MPLLICYKERNLYFCTVNGVWGDDFHKKFQILEKKKFSFYFITINFLMLLLHHKTLKGSRNIQGFALIRAVLFDLFFITFAIAKGYCNRVLDFFPVNNFVYRIHFWTLLLIFVLFAKTYSSRLQKLSMIEFVISNIRPVENLLFMLIVTFQTRFVKLYFLLYFCLFSA